MHAAMVAFPPDPTRVQCWLHEAQTLLEAFPLGLQVEVVLQEASEPWSSLHIVSSYPRIPSRRQNLLNAAVGRRLSHALGTLTTPRSQIVPTT